MRSEDAPVRWAAFYIVKAGLLSEGVPASFVSRIAVRRFHSFLIGSKPMIPITTSKMLHIASMSSGVWPSATSLR